MLDACFPDHASLGIGVDGSVRDDSDAEARVDAAAPVGSDVVSQVACTLAPLWFWVSGLRATEVFPASAPPPHGNAARQGRNTARSGPSTPSKRRPKG